jgi:hypothetical protein
MMKALLLLLPAKQVLLGSIARAAAAKGVDDVEGAREAEGVIEE